ncbi:hypothetical protein [Glycomyces tenuis]|uniref:hypothetical protein n=1 Tax=Glycomyces tenuis TaxID=58116 RepID=UPI00040772D1|nr:hypothetical protein [Glycomyces tenuis]
MKRLSRLLRSALAVLAGLLLAASLTAPASADDFQYAPTPFELQDVGEDFCTFFNTAGLAAWPIAEPSQFPTVNIQGDGWISYAPPDTICLSVEPSPRHILFTAYVDREPVDAHVEPFDRIDNGGPFEWFSYDFSFMSPVYAPIDYVTVEMCHTYIDDTGPVVECDEPAVVEPGGPGTGEQS